MLQKQLCWTIGIRLAVSHENAASLRLTYGYYFERCLSERAEFVTLVATQLAIAISACFFCQYSYML